MKSASRWFPYNDILELYSHEISLVLVTDSITLQISQDHVAMTGCLVNDKEVDVASSQCYSGICLQRPMKGLETAGAVVIHIWPVSNILSSLKDYCWLHQLAWF
jgi:hypothetical protein